MDDVEIGAQAREAAMLAVLAAGDPGNERQWRKRVQTHLPMFAALVRDNYGWFGREAQEVVDADVFTSTFLSMELEESSTRIIVHMQSDKAKDAKKNPEGLESIRTERTDTPRGWLMRDRLDKVEPGAELVVFKKTESINADMKVRVLVHFIELRSKRSTSDGESKPNRPAATTSADGGSPPSSNEPAGGGRIPPAGSHTEAVQENLDGLAPRQMIAVKNRCVGEGIEGWMNPSDEELDRVLVIISDIKKDN